jgi:signal transduction histidine kinase/DNA-binding NarL/FixJ family response regulator
LKRTLPLLLFIFHFSFFTCQAQNGHLIDSLQNELKKYEVHKKELGSKVTPLMDSSRANVLYQIFRSCKNYNNDSAMKYAKECFAISQKCGYKKGIGNGYSAVGQVYGMEGNYTEALNNDMASLKQYEEIKDSQGMARSYDYIGCDNYEKGNYPEALKTFFDALKLHEDNGNRNGITFAYNHIGLVYDAIGRFPEALKNYQLALNEKRENGDTDNIAMTYNVIGITYFHEHNYPEALSAEVKSLKLSEAVKDKNRMIWVYNYTGEIYFAQADYSNALKNYENSFAIAGELKQADDVAYASIHIGEIYVKQANFQQALIYELKGLTLAKETGSKNFTKDAYQNLSNIYAKLGNYKAAYDNEVLYKQYYDTIYNRENEKKLTGLQMQYDFDKKQDSIKAVTAKQQDSLKAEQGKKDAIATKEIQNQKNIKYSLLGGLALVLVFAGFVFRSLSLSRKQSIEIEKGKQRAEQSEKFKEQFLANMSHEIRTPMNAVNGMTELLLEKKPRADQLTYLEAIRKSSDTLLHIINDILDLSKIEAGKMEMEQIDFSLKDTIEQVKQTLSFRAEEKGLQLITQINENIPDVLVGDPVRLNQILVNLGGNAIKFTEKGSVHFNVKKTAQNGIAFSIIDTGIGIPKDKMQQVFESFSQANTSDNRKFGGTGLGLSISKQLVELQGGKISVESEENAGTTFSFTLNYPAGSKEKLEQRILSEHKIDGSTLNGMRILIADDNEYNRIVAKDTLMLKAVVQIDEAENGEQVLEQLKNHNYDVILMDVQMPVIDGFEATKQIRNNFPAPKNNTPIIALTASVFRTDLDKCKRAGMNNYVPKPYKPWQLFGAIAEATGKERRYSTKVTINYQPSATSPNVTDLAYLRKFCEGDEAKMKKYINMYLKAIPIFTDRIEEALKTQNNQEIGSQAHALKSKMLMMGMNQSRDLAQAIELQCKDGSDFGPMHDNLNSLLSQLVLSVEELSTSKYS